MNSLGMIRHAGNFSSLGFIYVGGRASLVCSDLSLVVLYEYGGSVYFGWRVDW